MDWTWYKRRRRPRPKLSLKDQIRARLETEDYTCRLPRTRIRYKLKKKLILFGGFVDQVWQ